MIPVKLSPRAVNQNQQINSIEKIQELYIHLLRKVELLRFAVDFFLLRNEPNFKRKRTPSIGIDGLKIESSENDFEAYEVICRKFGKEYYGMISHIFSLYAIHKQDTLLMNSRQYMIFLKDFFPEIIQNSLLTNLIEITYKKINKLQENCDLKGFVELLFELNKMKKKKENQRNKSESKSKNKKLESDKENKDENLSPVKERKIKVINDIQNISPKDQEFKQFLDENLVPKYKEISSKMKEHSFERIQIFFDSYEASNNPTVELFLEKDNFLKHIFSVYETLDIKVSNQSFISLNNFLKFGADYCIIPDIANAYQLRKIFMTYKKYETDIIDFPCFVILICCIAHIGLHDPPTQSFFEKIKRFLAFLEKKNEKISGELIIKKLLK